MLSFNIYSIPSLIGFIINGILAAYVLIRNPKGALNRQYFFFCLSFMIWGLGSTLTHMAQNSEIARWANDLRLIGISCFAPAFLHFFFIFTEKEKILAKKITYLLLYGPAVIFIALIIFTDLIIIHPPVKMYFGYISEPSPFLIFKIFSSWTAVYFLTALYLCWKFYRKTTDWKKKRVILLILIGNLVGFIFSFTGDAIFAGILKIYHPLLNDVPIIFSIFQIIFVAYAILKYGFMSITPQLAAPTIVKNMPDFLVVLDKELNIAFVNKNAADVLGYQEKEIQNRPFASIIEGEKEIQELKQTLVQEAPLNNYGINYLTKTKENIPVSLNSFPLLLKNQERLGTVTISRDMRQTKKFIQQIEKSKEDVEEKNRELEKTKADLEIKNKELQIKYQEIEQFNKLMIGRELKMAELKKEIDGLKKKLA